MPSNEEDPRRVASSSDANPFIAFRRYADERVSSFMQSVLGLPSAIRQPSAHARWSDDGYDAQRRAAHQKGEVKGLSVSSGSSSDDAGKDDGSDKMKRQNVEERNGGVKEVGSESESCVWDPWYPGSFRPSWWNEQADHEKPFDDAMKYGHRRLRQQSQTPRDGDSSNNQVSMPLSSDDAGKDEGRDKRKKQEDEQGKGWAKEVESKSKSSIWDPWFRPSLWDEQEDLDNSVQDMMECVGKELRQQSKPPSNRDSSNNQAPTPLSLAALFLAHCMDDMLKTPEYILPLLKIHRTLGHHYDRMFPDISEWPGWHGFLVGSPYSPIHLEQDPLLSSQGSKWRNAFEDLMLADQGKPLPDRRTGRGTESKEDRPQGCAEWIVELDARGILPKPALFDSDPEEEGEYHDGESLGSELDAYDRQHHQEWERKNEERDSDAASRMWWRQTVYRHGEELNERGTPEEREGLGSGNVKRHTEQRPTEKPGILSTLTTTERTTLPDGTVTTKIVLKKRFADGREESSETVHTSQRERPSSTGEAVASKRKALENEGKEKKKEKEKEKGSWFWSK